MSSTNELIAYFKGRVGVCESVYQHDYGRVLVLDGKEYIEPFDAYFEVQGVEESIPAVGQENRVAIPNACLANSGKVTLHIPIHAGENDSEVEDIITFKVIGRAKPMDDGTPAEQSAIAQAIAVLKRPITFIETIVNEALSFTGTTLDEFREEINDFEDDVNTSVTNLVTNVKPDTVKTLWTGLLDSDHPSVSLSEAVSNFDFLDFYYVGQPDSFERVPVSKGFVKISIAGFDETSAKTLRIGEMQLTFSGSTVSVSTSKYYELDGNATYAPPTISSGFIGFVNRIDGVKVASLTPAELTDIRTGADGQIYSTAGDAVRGQVTDLKSDISVISNTKPIPPFGWGIGFINTANGNSQSGTASIRTYLTFFKAGTVVDIGDGYHLQVYLYRDSYGGAIKRYADATPFVLPEDAKYRFCIEKSDSSTVTDDEINTLASQLTIKEKVMRWDILSEQIYTPNPFELPIAFSFGSVYTSNGSIANVNRFLMSVDNLPKWVASITPPTGCEISLLGYVGNIYEGVWTGSAFVKTSGTYRHSDTIMITPEMHKGRDLYISVHKIDDTSFDSNVLGGFMVTSVYGESVHEKSATTTVLGYDMLKTFDVTNAYAQELKTGITNWMTEYAGDANKIPFIVHTDQHGRLTLTNKKIFDLLSYLVNWDEVSAIFNLGDTVVDHWEDDNTNTNPLLRNGTLETALICLSSIPKDKQINIYGNHDTWYSGDEVTAIAGTLPSLKYLNPYFKATGLRTEKYKDNSGNMIIFDDKNMVKYLVLADWDYADKTGDYTGYQWYYINKNHLKWMIEKMTENTGHDLVIVSHVPLMIGSVNAYNPITNASEQRESPILIVHYSSQLNALWQARKNKISGSVQWDGETVYYDFTNCTDNLLCAIAGHTHFDAVDYVDGQNGLLQVAFDGFTDLTLHFGLFDRVNNSIKVWKVHNESNTPAVQYWEAPFDKPTV